MHFPGASCMIFTAQLSMSPSYTCWHLLSTINTVIILWESPLNSNCMYMRFVPPSQGSGFKLMVSSHLVMKKIQNKTTEAKPRTKVLFSDLILLIPYLFLVGDWLLVQGGLLEIRKMGIREHSEWSLWWSKVLRFIHFPYLCNYPIYSHPGHSWCYQIATHHLTQVLLSFSPCIYLETLTFSI